MDPKLVMIISIAMFVFLILFIKRMVKMILIMGILLFTIIILTFFGFFSFPFDFG